MILLLIFAFIAGFVTILSPCILPVLPIVLSGTVSGDKKRPLGIVAGFIGSFTFFTLFLSLIVRATGIPADTLRTVSVVVVFSFGLSLLIPKFQVLLEQLFSRLSGVVSIGREQTGFIGGIVIGISLGLVWTPCVGPILASVISLALTGSVTAQAFFITLAFSMGTAIPMLGITYGGRELLSKTPWLTKNTGRIQKVFGILMIVTAIGIQFNVDRTFQAFILETFPQYGVGLTRFEENSVIQNALKNLQPKSSQESIQIESGKPMSDVIEENIGTAPELIAGGKWFNSEPFTLRELRGNVVLIDFWTYTCINCIRTLPYLKDWYEKYKDNGLVIIGVHTPEFEFEKDAENVEKAIKDFGLTYPIMQDNNYATWKAYKNRYWPAKYLIDSKGKIRYTHFGEGEYQKTEEMIQKLLKERGEDVSNNYSQRPDETPRQRISPETYLGAARMEYYYPLGHIANGTQKLFTSSSSIPLNTFTLGGNWEITDEYAMAGKDAILEYHFTAEKVFLVMRPPNENIQGEVKVYIDGKSVDQTNSGSDVENGEIIIDSDRLYELINLQGANGEHILRLEFQTEGISLFAFTFG